MPYGSIIKADALDGETVCALDGIRARLRLLAFAPGIAPAGPAGAVAGFRGPIGAALLVGLVVGLSHACAWEGSPHSMNLQFIAVVTFGARVGFGTKSPHDA